MNVYDFDKTIYNGDSTVDFYLYCLRKHPKIAITLPRLVAAFVKYYILCIGTKTQFKQAMYSFLKYCDAKSDVENFWKTHKSNIKKWYLNQAEKTDVIISASPEFLLKPLEEDFDFSVIASRVNMKTGEYDGVNCYYDEKVRRFAEKYPEAQIENFYSDSYSDEPLAKISKNACIIDGDKILNWNYNKHIKPKI